MSSISKYLSLKLVPIKITIDAKSWYFWIRQFFYLEHFTEGIITRYQ